MDAHIHLRKKKGWEATLIFFSTMLGNGKQKEVRLLAKLQLRENGTSVETKT